jgi:hypothetical protein
MHGCWRVSLSVALIITLSWITTSLTKASPGVEITYTEVEYVFGGQITFRATIKSQAPIEHVLPTLQFNESPPIELSPLTPSYRGRVVAIYDASRGSLRAFSTITYWFQITFQDGTTTVSPQFQFYYQDNRFDWQTTRDGIFNVHHYQHQPDFIPEVLEVAQEGLLSALSYVPVFPPETIDIYVYDSAEDLQTSLQLSGDAQIAGHADPALSVILVSLPAGPDQWIHMRQRIPHEITHILTYQLVQENYPSLPAWLVEGLASLAELHPNNEFQILLDDAHQRNSLLPMSSLCQSFPADPSAAILAYAQSASFTKYLYHLYGLPGILHLLAQYTPATTCEMGLQQAFGVRLDRLENQWRRDSFSGALWLATYQQWLPWAVLLAAIMFAPLALTIRNLIDRGAKYDN